MKTFLLLVLSVLMLASVVHAELIDDGEFQPSYYTFDSGVSVGLVLVKPGTYWVRKDNKIYVGAQAAVVDWGRLVSLDLGTITAFNDNPPIIVGVMLNLNNLAQRLGVGIHLPGDSELGIFRGWDLSAPYGEGHFWGINWIIPLKG